MIRERAAHGSDLQHQPHTRREQIAPDPRVPNYSRGTKKGKGKVKDLKWVPYVWDKPRAQRSKRNVGAIAPRPEGEERANMPGPSGSNY